jgi:hypothetical protein
VNFLCQMDATNNWLRKVEDSEQWNVERMWLSSSVFCCYEIEVELRGADSRPDNCWRDWTENNVEPAHFIRRAARLRRDGSLILPKVE